jgi:hypothetical protein
MGRFRYGGKRRLVHVAVQHSQYKEVSAFGRRDRDFVRLSRFVPFGSGVNGRSDGVEMEGSSKKLVFCSYRGRREKSSEIHL